MVDEIKKEYGLTNIVTFAFGLLPWICRTIEYGKKGVNYGCKAVNYAAVSPRHYFKQLNDEFFNQVCFKWFGKGETMQADNFLSLTLSVDNQIIHTSRCLGLYKVYGESWKSSSIALISGSTSTAFSSVFSASRLKELKSSSTGVLGFSVGTVSVFNSN